MLAAKGVVLHVHTFVDCMSQNMLTLSESRSGIPLNIESFKQHLIDNGFVFGDIIPLILTDNGGEFSIVSAFENNSTDSIETHMFFAIQVHHTKSHILRKIIHYLEISFLMVFLLMISLKIQSTLFFRI